MSTKRSGGSLWFGLGLATGLVAGVAWWAQQQETHSRALFSRRPIRRLAALGFISGRPTIESVVTLRDYLGWERNQVLRRRARQLLTRFEKALA